MKQLIVVKYWPSTNQWRILVAGVAVGYWDSEDDARMRARWARRGLRDACKPASEAPAASEEETHGENIVH